MTEQQIQRGKEWLEGLLNLMGLPAAVKIGTIEQEADSKASWLTIDDNGLTPEQTAELIGERGEVIDAIQYLANVLNNLGIEPEEQKSFTVELNGYRVRRLAELKDLAEKAA